MTAPTRLTARCSPIVRQLGGRRVLLLTYLPQPRACVRGLAAQVQPLAPDVGPGPAVRTEPNLLACRYASMDHARRI